MAAGKKDIVLQKGEPYNKVWTWYTQDEAGVRTAKNLVGWTARWVFADVAGAVLFTLTTENGGIALGGAAGTITPNITEAMLDVVDPITATMGAHELELRSPGNVPKKLVRGGVRILPELET
jgi:hypothetical protein